MKIKIWILTFLIMIIALPFAAQSIYAQDKDKTKTDKKDDAAKKKEQKFTLKATKVEGNRGDDQNVKSDSLLNSQSADFPAPKEKGGNEAGTRGATGVCKVVFDNRTKWKIQIYVDGDFRGMMAPFGDSTAYTGAGLTRVYARAQFDDGSALNWGPTDYNCYSGQFIYFRMDP